MGKMETPVENGYLKAVGRITLNFAMLENAVSFFIWTLLGDDQVLGQIITAELSFNALLNLLNSLYRHRVGDPEKTAELAELVKEASKVKEKRDTVTHSFWAVGKTQETITRMKTTAKRKGLTHQVQEMSSVDLDDIADAIAKIAYDIQTFMIQTIFKPGH